MNYSKIGSIEAISLIIIVILNHIVLHFPKNLIDSCGPSSPINVIYISILIFIFLYFLVKLFKNFTSNDIIDISEFLGGKFLKIIIGILFILYFLITSSTSLRNFAEILKVTYFPNVNIYILLIAFLIVALIANKFGTNSVIRCNLIIVPLVLITLLIPFFLTITRYVPQRIFPILGYGFNETFFKGATNIFAINGIAYIYFLMPMLKKQENFKSISFIGIGISTLYLFLSVITLLFSFADVLSVNKLSSVYSLIRGADFGNFFQRPDAIFFLGWMLSLMSYLSISLMLITNIFRKITNIKNSSSMIYAFCSSIFIISLIPKGMEEIRYIENNILKIFTISLLFVISFIIMIISNIKYIKTHNKHPKEVDLIEN
ncbi:MAG: GerAB/ArcD/ProY family transporter [Clostridia bacterium]|nr:GerAB/ArcD/ProY family transporter [Clostridia bacterium]